MEVRRPMGVLSKVLTLWSLLRQRRLMAYLRAARLTRRYVDEWTNFPAFDLKPGARLRIHKAPGAKLVIRGKLVVFPWTNATGAALIELLEDSRMEVVGRWSLKDDTRVKLFPGAVLEVEGIKDRLQPSSMLGSRSQILVSKHVKIGANCAISFDCLITDSNWHAIEGKVKVEPTVLGEHVWVTPRCTILPGARIGRDSIVATGSVVMAGDHPERALLAGSPAKVVRITKEPWAL
jgi:acetyltransferase-like isoleucine patch superfamily enzyme